MTLKLEGVPNLIFEILQSQKTLIGFPLATTIIDRRHTQFCNGLFMKDLLLRHLKGLQTREDLLKISTVLQKTFESFPVIVDF